MTRSLRIIVVITFMFCGGICVADPAPPGKSSDSTQPREGATVDELTSQPLRLRGLDKAQLYSPYLHAPIEPSRHLTLDQPPLADMDFAIKKRWWNEYELTPMRSTGFWVNQGDTLQIDFAYTGAAPRPMPQVWIHDLHDDTWNYADTQKVALRQGNNTVRANGTGVVYIAVTNPPSNGTLTVDLRSGGRPMPYFILGQHAASDWPAMLERYSDSPYIELVGHRQMVTATYAQGRRYVADPVKTLELLDLIVATSEAQWGMYPDSPDLDRPPLGQRYHYMECLIHGGDCPYYAYAWDYRMAFSPEAMRPVLNANLLETSGWGPWHELGHLIQHDDLTVDAYNDVEATVNLTSLWVQTHLFDQKSRLETDRVWPKIATYLRQSSRDFDRQEDEWIRLGMYWQLALAFGPEYYPRYARYSRTLRSIHWDDKRPKQQRLVVETSRAAGYNLLPFYEKWGVPITAATRTEVNALGLPLLDKPIWENTDMQVLYKYYGDDADLPPTGEMVVAPEVNSYQRFSAVVNAVSFNGRPLTYRWTPGQFQQAEGADTDTLTVTAPAVQSPQPLTLSVQISDGQKQTTLTETVRVNPEVRRPPTVRITGVTEAEVGTQVVLDASGSTSNNPQGGNLTYSWQVPPGIDAQIDGAFARFTAPAVGAATGYRFALTVHDGSASASQYHSVTVTPGAVSECEAPPWSATKTYSTWNEAVSYDAKIYRQAWESRGKRPDLNSGPWGQPWMTGVPCAAQ